MLVGCCWVQLSTASQLGPVAIGCDGASRHPQREIGHCVPNQSEHPAAESAPQRIVSEGGQTGDSFQPHLLYAVVLVASGNSTGTGDVTNQRIEEAEELLPDARRVWVGLPVCAEAGEVRLHALDYLQALIVARTACLIRGRPGDERICLNAKVCGGVLGNTGDRM